MLTMSQEKIEELLQNKIGFSPGIIGSQEIARAVENRMEVCNMPNVGTYFQYLQTSSQELEELVELLIVPETWFFRDGEPFNFLEQYVFSEWWPNHRASTLRVLSVPCSTGEEPYSIAMTLINTGLTPNQFRIDAIDISNNSLLKAKEAIYTYNSFRGNNLDFQNRYFTKLGSKYQLGDLVKNAVNFSQGNLVDGKFLIERSSYDIIFCRNVLIYFDYEARKQSMQNLNRLLKNEGLLFLGHAETGQILEYDFVSVRHPFAFAYRKKVNHKQQLKASEDVDIKQPQKTIPNFKLTPVEPSTSNQKISITKPIQPPNPPATKLNSSIDQPISLNKTNEIKANQTPTINLETARKLADSGNLNEAAQLCETYLKEKSTSVEAYILLGEIYQAKAWEQKAEQCFQKAIYLEPNNYEALVHLTLLKEHRGDVAGATVLKQRIQRLKKA